MIRIILRKLGFLFCLKRLHMIDQADHCYSCCALSWLQFRLFMHYMYKSFLFYSVLILSFWLFVSVFAFLFLYFLIFLMTYLPSYSPYKFLLDYHPFTLSVLRLSLGSSKTILVSNTLRVIFHKLSLITR